MGIMMGIRTGTERLYTSLSLFPDEKVGYSPYSYLYLNDVRIFRQNGDGFTQYPETGLSIILLSSLSFNVFFLN